MSDLTQLLELMKHNPGAFQSLSITKVSRFITYATLLKRDILLAESVNHPVSEPPPCLPDSIETFLGESCQLPKGYTASCWDIFKETMWEGGVLKQEQQKKDFRVHGHALGLSRFINLVKVHKFRFPLNISLAYFVPTYAYVHIYRMQPQCEETASYES